MALKKQLMDNSCQTYLTVGDAGRQSKGHAALRREEEDDNLKLE